MGNNCSRGTKVDVMKQYEVCPSFSLFNYYCTQLPARLSFVHRIADTQDLVAGLAYNVTKIRNASRRSTRIIHEMEHSNALKLQQQSSPLTHSNTEQASLSQQSSVLDEGEDFGLLSNLKLCGTFQRKGISLVAPFIVPHFILFPLSRFSLIFFLFLSSLFRIR
jgi:hypothetical protein